ncbi:DNA polymerase IV [Ornithinimicrobium cryptoxanthini]|uniref:DNA polymerase IV n=1 Tax=Ornithinimicrobium cryptoxanthini TaxID=2934161 RepID=A0ABY4YE93_9MICO|nr:DNA polymerase IV [Ornithinimicrobium cryptoxanthini]USQ74880.1 DNA polymerase IV [Ornithinimicrobium cryptoxanthini]
MPPARRESSVLHLDLDAFFAAVEQRDKPSLRGRPVVVGGVGPRGVVSTASYEARKFGARSAMPTSEARRRCPAGTAFLGGRFDAYRMSSQVVMELLRDLSPVVEQVSVDEAYVDLAAGPPRDLTPAGLAALAEDLMERIQVATGGLTASVGIATSKMMAKIGSELNKPAGMTLIEPGTEQEVLGPMSVRAIAGVGPATAARLHAFGVETVADLARVSEGDLVAIFGLAQGASLTRLARAEDNRQVESQREAKSLSVEETFDVDIADPGALERELDLLVARLASRLGRAALFGRTTTVKVRQHDFSQVTRSGTLPWATGDPAVIGRQARRLLGAIDVSAGIRLLGVGVSGLTTHAQEELELGEGLFAVDLAISTEVEVPDSIGALPGGARVVEPPERRHTPEVADGVEWRPGADVHHEEYGAGWVWGSGLGRVTVRFEGPRTAPGPVRTFASDDPALAAGDPPDWRDG